MTGCPATHPRCQHTRDTDIRLYRCTCEAARSDRSRRQKAYRLRCLRGERLLMDATGTIRRLQALHVVGWRQIDIAERIGWHQQAVAQLLTDRTFVIARTAAAVARVYDELVETPGPSRVTVSRAKNQGWLGPGWWDVDTIDDPNYRPATTDRLRQGDVDRVAVELAVDGHPLPRRLTHAELLAATSVLHDRGASAREIAGRVRASERHVVRLLADLRQVA